ncbi:MAG: enolase C-terminal domain-like protein [Patescibacteria group bacterium]
MNPNKITKCFGREITDSRGTPTIEVILEAGEFLTKAQVPSGKSTGLHEAKELRDADGKGVKTAIDHLEKIIAPAIVGQKIDQKEIDSLLIFLDGTKDKSYLGANAMVGVSMAVARLAAMEKNMPLWKHITEEINTEPSLPHLYMNIINGGIHADFRLPFQEYMVVMEQENPRLAYEQGKNIFERLGQLIKNEFGRVEMGDEGGFSPNIDALKRPFEILNEVIAEEPNVFLAIDAAASQLFKNNKYELKNQSYNTEELANLYAELISQFSLKSIEDPFAEDMISDFSSLVEKISKEILIVGDDLTVTNPARIQEMIDKKAANALIIKPNQIGTITETYEAIRLARDAGWKVIVSHRSGDTLDAFISDLAVGLGAYGIKAGSPEPPERRAKYERLIEIYEKEMLL